MTAIVMDGNALRDEIVAKLELALADVFSQPDVVAAMDAAKCNAPPDGR